MRSLFFVGQSPKELQPFLRQLHPASRPVAAQMCIRDRLTIISTERSLDEILEIDEAVGSRIYERSKAYYLPLHAMNWRLR